MKAGEATRLGAEGQQQTKRLILRTRRKPYNIYTHNGTRLVGTAKAHSASFAIDDFMNRNGGYKRQDLSAVEVGRRRIP